MISIRNNKTTKVLLFGIILFLSFTWFPFVSKGADSFVLDPYVHITLQASGVSAYKYVERLTGMDMGGRQSGTEGCDKAASWIASQFQAIGLKPYQENTYLQSLPVPYFNLLPPLHFGFKGEGNWINAKYREEFIVFPYSGQGQISSDCVFIGYGIHAPDLGFNEYDGISVEKKTVCFLWNLPDFIKDDKEIFTYYNRINTAFDKGASSVILLLKTGIDTPINFSMKMAVGHDAHIPVILANQSLSYTLFQKSNQDLDKLVQTIESTKKPHSLSLNLEMKIEVHFESEIRTSNNVIGYIPAVDSGVKESILITSHYDGLGIDHIENTIYHGANDNASSIGCIMEVARNLLQNKCLPAVNLVFIAFTGEEVGLVGSRYYVKNPLFPLSKIKAVLNSEEIGTFEGVNIAGTSRTIYPELSKLITSSARFLKLEISIIADLLYPGSDHYPFHERDIPSVCFAKLPLPLGYPEYHKTADTIDIISPESLETFCQLITLMTLSYSHTAFIDFSHFPENSQSIHPYTTIHSTCYIPSDSALTLSINGKKLDLTLQEIPVNQLNLFIPLDKGSNQVLFEVKHKWDSLIKKSFTITCDSDQNLRADFNKDFRVDITDLQMIAKKIDTPSPIYLYNSLFDLNQDQVISIDDFILFSNFFGYSRL